MKYFSLISLLFLKFYSRGSIIARHWEGCVGYQWILTESAIKEATMVWRGLCRVFLLGLCTSVIYAGGQGNQGTDQQGIDQKWSDLKDKFVNTAQGAADGGLNFLKGMGQSIGVVTADYHYSYVVWNDSNVLVLAGQQRVVPAMGANISEDYDNSALIQPFSTSGKTFFNQQLYLNVVLYADPANTFFAKLTPTTDLNKFLTVASGQFGNLQIMFRQIYPWSPNDNNIYYYRVYFGGSQLKAEYLGVKTDSTDFLGSFFNNSKQEGQLSFTKDGKQYTVTLEILSFNSLQSTANNPTSIRPGPGETRSFVFTAGGKSAGSIPVQPLGIGNVAYNDTTKQYDPAGPMLYTYQLYDGATGPMVSMQGLSIGNFPQPVAGKVRDINPVKCHVWRQSATQEQQISVQNKEQTDPSSIPFDAVESFWVVYKTADYQLMQKIDAGKVADFTVVRPQIKEKEAWLYGVTLQTMDDAQAKKFLDRLASGKIGQGAVYSQVGLVGNKFDLSKLQANSNGKIVDVDPKDAASSGISGFVLFADRFLPTGVDSSADFYYYVQPPQLRIDQLISNMYLDDSFYIKDSSGALVLKPDVMQELTTNLINWVNNYNKDKTKVATDIKNYLALKGNKSLFAAIDPKTNAAAITPQGQHMIDALLTGPISIVNYPLVRKSGVNYYVFGLGSKPDGWPS